MQIERHTISAVIQAAIIVSLLAYVFVDSGSSFKVCVPTVGESTVRHQEAIKALDGVVDIGIKLSTTLVGLGAAVLLGFKSGLILSTAIRALLVLATLCFFQSALYGVLWRLRVAELWINDCLSLISESRLQFRYDAHFWFFLAGLFSMALLIAAGALSERAEKLEERS